MDEEHQAEEVSGGVEAETTAGTSSVRFIGQWRGLVSTTNWEKGRIISEWRAALIDDGVSPSEYSDESWSQLVGDVTPQHVGRLRRVHEKFHSVYPSYEGLYWTHFLAALDWEDAELWLEGALQNHWSVSNMRKRRWETLGSIPQDEPQDAQIVAEEASDETALGEDYPDLYVEDVAAIASDGSSVKPPANESPANTKSASSGSSSSKEPTGSTELGPSAATEEIPLDRLDDFPEDFAEALEDLRHAILAHQREGWVQLAQADVVRCLDSLRALALEA